MSSVLSRPARYSTAVLAAFVLLRFAIGWHFFSEGAKKLRDPDFRSAYFLDIAVGPLSPYCHSLIPDAFGVERLSAENRLARLNRRHEQVLERIGDDPQQRKIAERLLEEQRQSLEYFFASHAAEIAEHQLEVQRYQQATRDPNLAGIDSGREWLATKRDQLRGAAAPWIADLKSLDTAYRRALRQQLELDESALPRERDAGDKNWVDVTVSWTIFLTGVCLLLGLLTPLASLAGAAFLVLVISTQPFWVSGANLTYFPYQLVELTGLLLLAVSGAGCIAGLDFFLAALWRGSHSAAEET